MTRRDDALRLAALAGEALHLVDPRTGWPALGTIDVDGTTVPISAWVAPVGRSHRGRDSVERRFQNPGSNRPIWTDGTTVPLLLGLWDSDDLVAVPRPVLVSADPIRRSGRTTRFSVFVGVDSLLQGATEGWAEGHNAEGEWICCLEPGQLTRLLRTVLEVGLAGIEVGDAPIPASEFAVAGSRSDEIARLARAGLTLQEIGARVSVSSERVRQVLRDNWPDLVQSRKYLASRRRKEGSSRAEAEAKSDRWHRLREELGADGIDADEVLGHLLQSRHVPRTARAFKLDALRVSSLYEASPFEFPLVERGSTISQRHSDETIIDYLRKAALVLDVTLLTANAYNDFAARQNLTPDAWPSAQTVAKRFGGWRAACEAAGLDARAARREYFQDFPPARCRQFVDRYVRSALSSGDRPTLSGYAVWARTAGGPSAATVRNRLGAWTETLASSLGRIDEFKKPG